MHGSRTLGFLTLLALAPLGAQQRDSSRADSARARRDTSRTARLAPIHITGTRLSSTVDETMPTRVDQLDLRSAVPGAAAADAVARLPGVSVFDDQGTRAQPTIDIRGFDLSPVVGSPQGVSVFLDGVRINEPDAQELDFDLIPMEAVEHAELVRGPAALFGKNSLAGALILSTARGNATPTLETGAETGAFGYRAGRLTASGMWNGFDGYLLARGSNEDGFRADTRARTRMVFGTVGRKRAESDLALSVLVAHDRVFQAGSLPESWLRVNRRANFTLGDYFAPALLHTSVRGERRLLGGQLRGNLFARRNDREQFNVNVADPSVRARIANGSLGGTAELTLASRVGAQPFTLAVGTEYTRNDIRYRIFQEGTADAAVDPECEQPSGLCENARVIEDNAALYAQVTVAPGEALAITAAARADYVRIPFRDLRAPENDGTSTFQRISPLLGATYRAGNRLRLYVSASGGFRAPAALELACADPQAPCPLPFALGDDPPLRAVRVWNQEVGADWLPATGVAVRASGFRADGHDEIVFVGSQTAAGYFQNIARTRRQGVEVSAALALPAGVRASASYAYVDATYRSTVQLASAIPDAAPAHPGDRFPLVPAHRATARVAVTRSRRTTVLEGELSARAVSSRFLRGDEANDHPPVPGHVVAGLRLAATHGRASGALHLDNLLNERYTTFGVYGLNPLGPPTGPRPPSPALERFLTPGYPRTFAVSVAVRLF